MCQCLYIQNGLTALGDLASGATGFVHIFPLYTADISPEGAFLNGIYHFAHNGDGVGAIFVQDDKKKDIAYLFWLSYNYPINKTHLFMKGHETKMKSIKKLIALMIAMAMMFALAACGSDNNDANNNNGGEDNSENQEKETITIGTSADYAPYEFHTMLNGTDTIVGADIEMAKKLAEDMGKELEIKDISFDVLLNELQNGTVDIVIAGMSADESRLAQADASDIYYDAAYQSLVVRTEDAEKFKSFADFEGAKVGVQSGTIQVGLAGESMPGCDLLILQGVPDIFNNLINGKCDAALVDGPVGDGYIAANEGLVAVDVEFPAQDGFSVWVQKDDPKGLLESINSTIAAMNESGQYAQWVAEAEELAGEE